MTDIVSTEKYVGEIELLVLLCFCVCEECCGVVYVIFRRIELNLVFVIGGEVRSLCVCRWITVVSYVCNFVGDP